MISELGDDDRGLNTYAKIDVSVVVLLYNEEENITPCVEELIRVLDELPQTFEVLLVDDGSTDSTGSRAFILHELDPRVGVIQFRRNFGQTAAIAAGMDAARGRSVVLMDGDMQNDPADIPKLLELRSQGYDVVSGWRKERKDALVLRRIPSKFANALLSRVTGTHLHDFGCTLKAYSAEVVAELRLYGELHRFIPALATMSGASVVEVAVNHRPRTRGKSKYGISRTLRVLLDLITVRFLLKYMRRPMQFFGRFGVVGLLLGFAAVGWGIATLANTGWGGRFLLFLGGTLIGLGIECLLLGLVAEMLTRVYFEGRGLRSYSIRRTAGVIRTINQSTDSPDDDL
jgi:glycosyltransferase involved in cell wall biosynthesis